MKPHRITFTVLFSMLAMVYLASLAPLAAAKPLKVFILVGQSNMEGHAQTMTFPAIAKDPETVGLYKDMVDADGTPVICKDAWIAYTFGDFLGDPVGKRHGQLTAGYGSQHHIGTGKIGPEFTFGIYTQKLLNEPILIIKCAWGGKSLMVDFRPPSAGEISDQVVREKSGDKAGKYYAHMMEHIKEVLADPKKTYPGYNPADGYELSGFVWFQGFNDMVGPYPALPAEKGKKAQKDYSEYSRLLSCLIRDVRKDLSAPKLPFVIGVLGVGGEKANEAFVKSMAAPAETEEFKGNVVNVFSAKYWPTEIDAVLEKVNTINAEFDPQLKELKAKNLEKSEHRKVEGEIKAEIRAKVEKTLSADELFLFDNGRSNQAFHYHGSAKFFGKLGKAFAEALHGMK